MGKNIALGKTSYPNSSVWVPQKFFKDHYECPVGPKMGRRP